MEKESLKMIVFYDAENISPEKVPNIHKFLISLGTIVEQHAYGEFLVMRYPEKWDFLVKFVQLSLHDTFHDDKVEVADLYLIIDAMDYAHRNPDCAIVIVSSGNDFSKLSANLKSWGRTVIGIGKRNKCKHFSSWVNSCSKFYYFEEINGNPEPKMVKIPRQDYYIGKYPVTQEEYAGIMKENPSDFDDDNLPVENVSWNDAMAFCKKLTERERVAGRLPKGYKYTLPTSAQWEIACRAGTTTKFYSGDSESDLASVAWYFENSGDKTHPVGQKDPNAWGIYDMHGNVNEWCLDAPLRDSSKRVDRGGSWADPAGRCESSYFSSDYPDSRYGNFGFRVALVPEGQ